MKPVRTDGVDPAARGRARRRALQAIYAWQLSGTPIDQVIEQFADEQQMEIADVGYFEALVRGVAAQCADLDGSLQPWLDRDIAAIDPIERAVLRLGTFELRHRADVPYRVIINEAVDIAKRFGAMHGHTFVNGVLDRVAAHSRAAEYRR